MSKKAVTLVEILLVVVLSALLMTVIIPFIRSVSDTWNVGSSRTEILQNGRASLETMTRYIRQAKRITGIPGSPGNYIKIRDWQDTYNIIFYHNVSGSPYYIGDSGIIENNDLVMRTDSTGTDVDSLLASSLDSLSFNFFRDDGTSATKANQVKSVQIRMQLSDPLGSTTHTLALEDTVILRQDVKVPTPIWAIGSEGSAPLYDRLTEIANDIQVDGFRISNVIYDASDGLSVDPTDGSCWVTDTANDSVKKISLTGALLFELSGFSKPNAVSFNGDHNTVWVADTGNNRIWRFYWTGSSWAYAIFSGFKTPSSISVNPNDNNQEVCWVADTGNNRIKKIDSNGTILLEIKGFNRPRSVSVNRSTGECWVADTNNNRVKKIRPTDGKVIVDERVFKRPRSVSVNRSTGECWVADTDNNRIKKLSPSGSVLVDKDGFIRPQSVSVNPTDGTCWLADYGNNQVVRLNSDGDEEFRISGFVNPVAVAVSPNP